MDFISNSETQFSEMLQIIGAKNVDDLFHAIPPSLFCKTLKEDDGLSESEALHTLEAIGKKNLFPEFTHYLGGGAYEHYIPALVSFICSKSNFLTAYTPYQAEVSQGMLQVIFEFQSMICALTGLDVANASVYDGTSALGEAVLMALRLNKKRKKILLDGALHPLHVKGLEVYLSSLDVEVKTLSLKEDFSLDWKEGEKALDEEVAAVVLQSPNYFGVVQDCRSFFSKAKEKGAITLLSANPIAYGLFLSAKEQGADIAFGDTQPLGIPLQFGGPYVGYLAAKEEYVRQMPGRIVGETVDLEGKRGFVLTLQAREQHIRREKATSNICSNQTLASLASLITALWYGPKGMHELALENYQRTAYLKKELSKFPFIETFETPFFNEFVLKVRGNLSEITGFFEKEGILPGIALSKFFLKLDSHLLVSVTETKQKKDLDKYVSTMEKAGRCLVS